MTLDREKKEHYREVVKILTGQKVGAGGDMHKTAASIILELISAYEKLEEDAAAGATGLLKDRLYETEALLGVRNMECAELRRISAEFIRQIKEMLAKAEESKRILHV